MGQAQMFTSVRQSNCSTVKYNIILWVTATGTHKWIEKMTFQALALHHVGFFFELFRK